MRWVARSGALIKSNKIWSLPPPPSTFKSHKLLFFMIIGCSWSWIVRWLLCEQHYEGNTREWERDCHSTQGCGASAWWTFPFYSAAASIHIHESEIFYGCYTAVVVADDRSIYIYCVLDCCCWLPYGNCKLCVKPLSSARSSAAAAATKTKISRKRFYLLTNIIVFGSLGCEPLIRSHNHMQYKNNNIPKHWLWMFISMPLPIAGI